MRGARVVLLPHHAVRKIVSAAANIGERLTHVPIKVDLDPCL